MNAFTAVAASNATQTQKRKHDKLSDKPCDSKQQQSDRIASPGVMDLQPAMINFLNMQDLARLAGTRAAYRDLPAKRMARFYRCTQHTGCDHNSSRKKCVCGQKILKEKTCGCEVDLLAMIHLLQRLGATGDITVVPPNTLGQSWGRRCNAACLVFNADQGRFGVIELADIFGLVPDTTDAHSWVDVIRRTVVSTHTQHRGFVEDGSGFLQATVQKNNKIRIQLPKAREIRVGHRVIPMKSHEFTATCVFRLWTDDDCIKLYRRGASVSTRILRKRPLKKAQVSAKK